MMQSVIELPPFDVGALHESATSPSPAVAMTAVGAPGVVQAVTALDEVEYELSPAALVAATLNLYDVPFVRPVTVNVVLEDWVAVATDHVPQLSVASGAYDTLY